ncbi:leucine rich repeat protein [Leptospira santarosai str. CBC379]|uniref:Leucine rich repeat protein n=1 Tax=Leptospira santarosai str. MOR084 TaxID=1049984 RepID=A0A0E2BHM1_9LEPT|nr:leucine rich repeat protein [Leptospira santarosai str. MOR084]EKR92181.1 leucine rich repeat protein [Leptospira santarosai str. CBC379]
MNYNQTKRLILCVFFCFFYKLDAEDYSKLNEALQNPTQVRVLHLNGKKLTALPKEIGKLQNLKDLYLGGNPSLIGQKEKIQKLLPNVRINFD